MVIRIHWKDSPTKSGVFVVKKKMCHAILGSDVMFPCTHACIYCYTRQLEYLHANGEKLKIYETDIYRRLPEYIDKITSRSRIKYPIRYGMLSDVARPYEYSTEIMRRILEVHLKNEYPAMVFTKAPLHKYMPDIIYELGRRGLLCVAVTITTFDRDLYKTTEPLAPTPEERAEFIRWLNDRGICWSLRVTPLFQGLTDDPETFKDILRRLPIGHVVVEYLRVNKKIHKEFFERLGVGPWEWRKPFYTAPREYARERFLQLRRVAHELGWTFAVCGGYHGFKIQDTRDCCTGRWDFYGRFMDTYDTSLPAPRQVKDTVRRARSNSPLYLFKGPEVNLCDLGEC